MLKTLKIKYNCLRLARCKDSTFLDHVRFSDAKLHYGFSIHSEAQNFYTIIQRTI